MQVPKSQPASVTLPRPLGALATVVALAVFSSSRVVYKQNHSIMYALSSFGSFNSASLFWDKSTVPDSGSLGTAKPLSTYRFTAFIGWGLSGVQVLAVSNDICMNVHIQVLCYPFNCRERRDCLVGTHLIFWEVAKLFSKEAVPFCIPASGVPGIHSLRILPQTWSGASTFSLSGACSDVSLHFSHHLWSGVLFLVLFIQDILYIFCKITIQFLPVFHCYFLQYSVETVLYVFQIQVRYCQIPILQTSPPSLWLVFLFL